MTTTDAYRPETGGYAYLAGYDVSYVEYDGGHDIPGLRRDLPDELRTGTSHLCGQSSPLNCSEKRRVSESVRIYQR